ncbi:RNA 2'-phosphotransferase [Undibacterium umbellatum]|uniref:Probable RNA 2'-phosphotransferase n=1 Tax=Undibacterium umbellatum TaxID=2762300 RepID=A0ABR6ZAT1_9BURK|nr:RNA 2'-phosphotransferase [Undibacterium umbellatum]MBC3908431.1 RNA 2'-phosphotransferase [Undibacterium umbellatum]
MKNKDKSLSKFLSYVLRHQPDSIDIKLDEQGWTEIAALINQAARHGKRFKLEDLHEAVRTSDKQRFAVSEDGLRIRANQGHSVKVDLALPVTVPPDVLYHGTASRFIASIMKEGLRPGSRHHVHLSTTITTARTVGARHGAPVILKVMAEQMQEDGFQFLVSPNGVWLCDSVPSKYLIRMSDDK